MPGRSFCSPGDFNAQLAQWLPTANRRRVRVLDGRPVDFLDPERTQMLALPPVPPAVENGDLGAAGTRLLRAGGRQ